MSPSGRSGVKIHPSLCAPNYSMHPSAFFRSFFFADPCKCFYGWCYFKKPSML